MRRTAILALALVASTVLLPARPLLAQATITPAAGQTAEQMSADQAACETEAAARTGYHPSQAAPAPVQSQRGQRVAGAARGAAVGGIVARRTDKSEREVEDPAAAGAAAGVVVGGSRARQERRAAARETGAQQEAFAQQQAAYADAFAACMTARGYTIQ
jgi:outer membrane lipoprotein SlyB